MNSARSNPLPMLFGNLLGLNTQNMRSSAVAKVISANSSDCLRPWAVADKWAEADGTWDPTDTFDPAAGDDYRPPNERGPSDPGTGFKVPPAMPNDYGTLLTIKAFAAVIMGGFGRVSGTIIAAFILGIAEAFAIQYISSGYVDAIAFLIMIATLLFRPYGLFGRTVGI